MDEKAKQLQIQIRDLENEISGLINRKQVLSSEINSLIEHRKQLDKNIGTMEANQNIEFEDLKSLDIQINQKRHEKEQSEENLKWYQNETIKSLEKRIYDNKLEMEKKQILFEQKKKKLDNTALLVRLGQEENKKEVWRLLDIKKGLEESKDRFSDEQKKLLKDQKQLIEDKKVIEKLKKSVKVLTEERVLSLRKATIMEYNRGVVLKEAQKQLREAQNLYKSAENLKKKYNFLLQSMDERGEKLRVKEIQLNDREGTLKSAILEWERKGVKLNG